MHHTLRKTEEEKKAKEMHRPHCLLHNYNNHAESLMKSNIKKITENRIPTSQPTSMKQTNECVTISALKAESWKLFAWQFSIALLLAQHEQCIIIVTKKKKAFTWASTVPAIYAAAAPTAPFSTITTINKIINWNQVEFFCFRFLFLFCSSFRIATNYALQWRTIQCAATAEIIRHSKLIWLKLE